MNKELFIKAVIILIIVNLYHSGKGGEDVKSYQDLKYIEPLTYDYFRRRAPEEVRQRCNFEIMNAYSLYGDAPSLGFKNEICPKLTENCCGPRDIKKIPELWKYDQKRMQAHNVVYLRTLKYFLGFGREYYKLAKRIIEIYNRDKKGEKFGRLADKNAKAADKDLDLNLTEDCYKAAEAVTTINYDITPKLSIVYDQLNERARFLQTFRYNFYCMMCSPVGIKSVKLDKKFWFMTLRNKQIRYNKNLCYTFANNTIDITYQLMNNYSKFLEKSILLSRCVKVKDNKFNTSSEQFLKLANDPLGLKDAKSMNRIKKCKKSFKKGEFNFGDCKSYCNSFRITSPTNIFDGDLERLVEVFTYMEQLERFFEFPSINAFDDDMAILKTSIYEFRKKVDRRFFKSIDTRIDFADYKSKFESDNYVDPMEMGDNNTLYFQYLSTNMLAVGSIFAIFYMLW